MLQFAIASLLNYCQARFGGLAGCAYADISCVQLLLGRDADWGGLTSIRA